jgi:DNA ligase-1
MNKKEANAILRKKYGASWFDRPGVKDEQRALMRGEAAPKAAPKAPKPKAAPKARRRSSSGPPTAVAKAKTWKGKIDPTGWWMSEKLDGMRAYWTGSGLFSSLGNPIAAPDWLTDMLPDEALDGELWLGRGNFQDLISIARKKTARDPRWKQVQFVVFDAPEVPGGFEKRTAALKKLVDEACRGQRACPLVFLDQTKCKSKADLKKYLSSVERKGGEGLMLRAPNSGYRRSRTSDMLKVVSLQRAEAKITGHEKGKGKHAGRLGAYIAKFPSGATFNVGTGLSDRDRSTPLRKGTWITVQFKGYTDSGKPRQPSFIGARDYE